MIAPIAMWPFDFSLVRNEVSNDVSLSMWRWAISPSCGRAQHPPRLAQDRQWRFPCQTPPAGKGCRLGGFDRVLRGPGRRISHRLAEAAGGLLGSVDGDPGEGPGPLAVLGGRRLALRQ